MRKKGVLLLSTVLLLISSGIALAVPPNQGEVGFEEGVFSLMSSDKNFVMKIGGRLQLRYWYAIADDENPWVVSTDTSSFEVYQARFYLGGNVFNPKCRYFLQLDFANKNIFQDGYIDYYASSYLGVVAGRFRPPYTRQKITSGTVLLFTKRSIVNDFFNIGRDMGWMAYGNFHKNLISYQIGMFNGDGEDAKVNTGKEHMYVARILLQPFGEVLLNEARSKSTPGFHFVIGGSYIYNRPPLTGNLDGDGDIDDALDTRWGGEMAVAWGPLYWSSEVNGKFYNPDIDGMRSTSSLGWYTQAGLLVVPDRLQIGARYAWLDPNLDNKHDGSNADVRQEFTVGGNYYVHGIRLMLQGSYSLFTHEFPDRPDPTVKTVYETETGIEHRVMFQLQLII